MASVAAHLLPPPGAPGLDCRERPHTRAGVRVDVWAHGLSTAGDHYTLINTVILDGDVEMPEEGLVVGEPTGSPRRHDLAVAQVPNDRVPLLDAEDVLRARQGEAEDAAAAVRPLDPDAPAVRFDDAAAHRQADAQAVGVGASA